MTKKRSLREKEVRFFIDPCSFGLFSLLRELCVLSNQESKYLRNWGNYFFLGTLGFLCTFLGCQQTSVEKIDEAVTTNFLNDIAIEILQNEGYTILVNDTTHIKTDWKTKLSPYYKNGTREQVEIFIHSINKEQQIHLKVIHQVNYTTHDYLNEQQALWVPNGQNILKEKLLLSLIKQKILLGKGVPK